MKSTLRFSLSTHRSFSWNQPLRILRFFIDFLDCLLITCTWNWMNPLRTWKARTPLASDWPAIPLRRYHLAIRPFISKRREKSTPPESHQIAERGSTDFTYLRIENHHFELGKEKATMLKNIPAILSEGFTAVQRLCLRGSLSYVIVYNGFIFLRFACTVHWDKITLGGS